MGGASGATNTAFGLGRGRHSQAAATTERLPCTTWRDAGAQSNELGQQHRARREAGPSGAGTSLTRAGAVGGSPYLPLSESLHCGGDEADDVSASEGADDAAAYDKADNAAGQDEADAAGAYDGTDAAAAEDKADDAIIDDEANAAAADDEDYHAASDQELSAWRNFYAECDDRASRSETWLSSSASSSSSAHPEHPLGAAFFDEVFQEDEMPPGACPFRSKEEFFCFPTVSTTVGLTAQQYNIMRSFHNAGRSHQKTLPCYSTTSKHIIPAALKAGVIPMEVLEHERGKGCDAQQPRSERLCVSRHLLQVIPR